ncbi:NfeD family protein [Teredinibacter waterburyi]|jgi:NfeD-like.|uniref:NfeD family protein n=1 Tax=Teredinibacter waterburyi TaxID=1500538 RepID=UPI00165FEF22|nr:NfeD family protein [Teredinibacter waterburyi]
MNDLVISYPTWLTIVGVSLVILEFVVFGFSTLFLLFIALGCFVTALILYVGILEPALLPISISVGIFSLLATALLWKPMRKFQNSQQSPEIQPNAFAGVKFRLSADLAANAGVTDVVTQRYSGIEWDLELFDEHEELIVAGTEVEVKRAAVGKLYVVRTS